MDYNGLLSLVVDTHGSQVTTAQANALLPMVEARLNRIIDHPALEVEAYMTPMGDPTLPSDLWRLRDLWVAGSPDKTLRQMSSDAARSLYGSDSGALRAYSISGSTLDLWPTPSADSQDVIHIRYQQTIPALGATTETNWLLSSHPDVYYYGLLLQCEAYIVNDERIPLWKQAFDEAVAELSEDGRKRRYGASPLVRYPYTYA